MKAIVLATVLFGALFATTSTTEARWGYYGRPYYRPYVARPYYGGYYRGPYRRPYYYGGYGAYRPYRAWGPGYSWYY